jgi:hypothetical protein
VILVVPRFLGFFGKHIIAMAIYPFILVCNRDSEKMEVTIRHEKIHFRQQLEMLILPFYIAYITYYFVYRLQGLKHWDAYRMIPFEKEAYRYEYDEAYLGRRPIWAWLQFRL